MPRSTFDISLIYHDIEISSGPINIGFIKFPNPFEYRTYTKSASFDKIIKPFGLVEISLINVGWKTKDPHVWEKQIEFVTLFPSIIRRAYKTDK